jgi:hypothetical protein
MLGVVLCAIAIAYGQTVQRGYLYARLKQLQKQEMQQEKSGKKNTPAHQMLEESHWLLNSTRDYARISSRLDAVQKAIDDPENLTAHDEQSDADGSWGRWYTEWFLKLDASYDQIADLADRGELPKYPPRFLDRINSPQKLDEHLSALLTSDPDQGIDRRRELNETIADLMRLILRGQPANYEYDPQLKDAMLDFLLNRARNPDTGYWGAWYRSGNQITKTNDLSITFHIVSYLHGEVPDWPKIIDTTLAMKDREYPLGWLNDGKYSNHNNTDAIELFRLGWPHCSSAQQQAMRVEIKKMLEWCLAQSLQPDGSFRADEHDDSLETAVSFGASFLKRAGYFDRESRFWTDEAFPDADKVRARIIDFIRGHLASGAEGGIYYRGALRELGAKSTAD